MIFIYLHIGDQMTFIPPKGSQPDIRWKVVERVGDHHESLHNFGVAENDNPLKVKYRINEWATAPIGGLLVFDSKEQAENFIWELRQNNIDAHIYKDLRLFRCRCRDRCYLPSKRLVKVNGNNRRLVATQEKQYMQKVWAGAEINNPASEIASFAWPAGTMAYRHVVLLDEVDTNYITVAC